MIADPLLLKAMLFAAKATLIFQACLIFYFFGKDEKVPYAARNIFLDHDPSIKAIKRQLAALTKFATKTGYGIALGHPRKTTIEALSQWLPILPEQGVLLAPLTEIVLNYQNQEKR